MRIQSTVCLGFAAAVFGIIAATRVAPIAAAHSERKPAATVPTFAKDVAPIFYKNCTGCHRPGEIAPMSLLTYEDARPYARAIREEIEDGHMPPWHADAPAGTFENERRLTEAEKKTIFDWIEGGAPKGDLKEMPKAPQYVEGWSIGKPDVILEMPDAYTVPAKGTVAYEYFYIPTNFTEPKFIQAIEVRPGDRSVVHHVLVHYHGQPGHDANAGAEVQSRPAAAAAAVLGEHRPRREQGVPTRLIATYAPGTSTQIYRAGTALRLEAGGTIELQMHYTANGKEASTAPGSG